MGTCVRHRGKFCNSNAGKCKQSVNLPFTESLNQSKHHTWHHFPKMNTTADDNNNSEMHMRWILFTNKALPTIRHWDQIWWKRYCLLSKDYATYLPGVLTLYLKRNEQMKISAHLINSSEWGKELAQKSCNNAGHMHKWTLKQKGSYHHHTIHNF